MTLHFIKNFIVEGRAVKLEIKPLPYKKTDLDPAISEKTLDYHYGHLAKTYAERYNKGEGDDDFNEAGVFLHNILFQQYQSPSNNNTPNDKVKELIDKKYKSFSKFKEEFSKVAMSIQGSGWVYLSNSGEIKTIKNHEVKKDILLLIDWWEHAWALDYQHDKKKYLENQWKIINWDYINEQTTI